MRKIGRFWAGAVLFFSIFAAILPAYASRFTHERKKTPSVVSVRLVSFVPPASDVGGKDADIYRVGDKPVRKVQLSASALVIDVGYMEQLMGFVLPDDAANKTMRWFSDDTRVATVDANGLVNGIGRGVANITAVSHDGKKRATCRVTVVGERAKADSNNCSAANGFALSLLSFVPLMLRTEKP